ncbi:MAG: HlyD family type I secretion periplasmic adaptor subunit [Pseudomonadota bacterium]
MRIILSIVLITAALLVAVSVYGPFPQLNAWSSGLLSSASETFVWLPAGGVQSAVAAAVVLLLLAGVAVFFSRRRPTPDEPPASTALADLDVTTRGPKRIAWAVLIVFFGVGGVWAGTASLSGAAIAPGVISPDGRRIVVQHLEGGVVAELLVSEGEQVTQDMPLAVIADVDSRTDTEALTLELATLRVEEALWEAEEAGQEGFEVPAGIMDAIPHRAEEVIASARQLHEQSVNARQAEVALIEGRKAEILKQLDGLDSEQLSFERQLSILSEELAANEQLFEQGLTPRSRVAALQREDARLTGAIDTIQTRRSVFLENLRNLDRQVVAITGREREEASEKLVSVRRKINETESLLEKSTDELSRTEIRAPVNGVVLQMRMSRAGGVLGPGEPLLDLVPTGGDLVVDARVRPSDIDSVRTGQTARVILTAYQQRNLAPLLGKVRQVSPDTITDQSTGETYFLAVIEVPEQELEKARRGSNQDIKLLAGMPAQVMIVTADRTLASYLFAPFIDSMRRSFRET